MDISLDEQMEIAKRYDRPLSLIFFDIDHFKEINDTYGHKTGDNTLEKISYLVKKSLRKSDIFGRWGGEEFLIILPETTKHEAIALAEKIRKLIEEYSFDTIGNITCSFGVSKLNKEDISTTILSRVDCRLYEAKKCGRNIIIAD
jgi:polar amino acid transport system substrate-binding protein